MMVEDSIKVQDSVIMGDINVQNISNQILECPNCGMQGVPVIRCANSDCLERFCYECERRWSSFRSRDELPLCNTCSELKKQEKEAAALALGVTPLSQESKAKFHTPESDVTHSFRSTLPEGLTHKKGEVDLYGHKHESGDLGTLLFKFTIILCSSLFFGMIWFLIF